MQPRFLLSFIVFTLLACSPIEQTPDTADAPPDNTTLEASFLPTQNRIMLVIGQDLGAVEGYVKSGKFPTPGGVTTYTNLYDLNNLEKAYAGLGLDNAFQPTDEDASWWGSGRHNAHKSTQQHPQSALVIGLDITEKYAPNGLKRIVAGEFDPQIDKLATLLKMVEVPVFLRIGYEFDGTWNKGYQHAEHYKDAWRTIVDRLRRASVTNVAYVWQASASPADDAIEGAFEEDLLRWYPGDAYVDWMGISWFLLPDEHGTNSKATATQSQLADQLLAIARDREKPVMVAEASPQGYFIERGINANIGGVIDGPSGANVVPKTGEQIWTEWYAPFFQYVHKNADIIRAVAYINVYWDAQEKWAPPYKEGLWGDSRIQVDPHISAAWNKEIGKPIWLHGGPELRANLGGVQ